MLTEPSLELDAPATARPKPAVEEIAIAAAEHGNGARSASTGPKEGAIGAHADEVDVSENGATTSSNREVQALIRRAQQAIGDGPGAPVPMLEAAGRQAEQEFYRQGRIRLAFHLSVAVPTLALLAYGYFVYRELNHLYFPAYVVLKRVTYTLQGRMKLIPQLLPDRSEVSLDEGNAFQQLQTLQANAQTEDILARAAALEMWSGELRKMVYTPDSRAVSGLWQGRDYLRLKLIESEARERELRLEFNREARDYNRFSRRPDAYFLIRVIGFPEKLPLFRSHPSSGPA